MPYTIDRMASSELQAKAPELVTMTRRALDWLGRHEHFILQVEGGRVDHGAHNCDAAATLREMLAFDEALEVALEFQRTRPDTLIVITTDHGNGNLGVNSSGSQTSKMFRRVAETKSSFVEIMRALRQRPPATAALIAEDQKPVSSSAAAPKTKEYVPTIKEIQGIIEAATGYKVPNRPAGLFQEFLAKEGATIYDLMNSEMVQLGQLLANHIAVGWTGGAHTADYVPVTALGPGAERFAGFLQNTDIFRHYTQLGGIDFRNPEEPLIGALDRESHQTEHLREYMIA
jgi:alkaline phosphatase